MLELPKIVKPQTDPAPKWFHVAVAASMILSTLSAVYGSLRTSATMEALVKENTRLVMASSTPLLEFGHGNIDDVTKKPGLQFSVTNVGNGPARIVWFKLKADGQAVENLSQLTRNLNPTYALPMDIETSTIAPRLISAGKSTTLFYWALPKPEEKEAVAAWSALDKYRQNKLQAEACYCSVLDACWTSNLGGDIPKPVKTCDM